MMNISLYWFSPGASVVNNMIYAMSYDYTTVYNDRTGSKSATLTCPSNLLSSSFNQDNTLLDNGSDDGLLTRDHPPH